MNTKQEQLMKNHRQLADFVRTAIHFHRSIFAFLIVVVPFTALQGQDMKTKQREQLSSAPKALPSSIQHQVQALGTRMWMAGKEETSLDAQFADDVGNKKLIHVTYQISGAVRIEGIHDKTPVIFDGEFTHDVANRTDEVLMDTFVSDTPEAMFYSLRKGASVVFLGHDFQLDSRTAPDVRNPRYDVYVVTAPDRIRTRTLQTRRFYFDSTTGLLASTRYSDAAGVRVETRFLNWEHIDGSAYPTTVERYENGHPAFFITGSKVIGQPQQNASTIQ